MSLAIVWFRRDLRLADNPALCAACAAHERVLPLYIHAPQEERDWAPGAASRWWLHHALDALRASLHVHHAELHLRQGDSERILAALIKATGAEAVYWNRLYEPAAVARDTRIKQVLREQGVAAHSFNGALWREPWQVETKTGDPYRVFTPFWRNLRTMIDGSEPLPVPQPLRGATVDGGVTLESLELLPRIRWDTGMAEAWTPGERGAQEMLELFADDAVNDYAEGRDIPSRHGTSRLSPHLHFGEVSPRQIQAGLHRLLSGRTGRPTDVEPFLRELGWREFAHHLMFHFPETHTANFNPKFDGFPWAAADEALIERWQRGCTGIPLVDAGMRELWHTGWMHNRVRMVVASFLTKNLRQHWHHGARWFWDTLVDADLPNNSLGWQWVAGCGADAAPYFRVFNPVSQSQKFDPKGEYLARWLPELAGAVPALRHEPWKDPSLLRRSGYPAPMVDLGESRAAALAAYGTLQGR
ncbi:deoxyribodipyrimidine photo-lyase [Dyella thiooxydans]|uniref:Deoxyribodipyrimidine photo-lyase n=1 Tax=Dyella thiooxydans TaxID=445710 RepID=A0A160MZ03_9GAMM|nr:deoxyribodipyrimidine photo-lyase [Dyella thiooxydans]AND68344.1 deoxyribodipyrimidine photo-lyase [Dyella thiooxydans]